MENKIHVMEYYEKTLNNQKIIIKPQKSWKFIQEKNKGREDLIAFSEDDKKITYGEMYEQWDEVARVLSGYDMTRENNSRILVLMPNLAKTGFHDYGADMTGAIVDYIDPTSSYDKIRKYVENEKITDIFALDLLLAQNVGKKVEELKKDFGLNSIIVYRDFYMNSLMPKKIKMFSSALNVASKFSKYVIRYNDAVKNTKNTKIIYDTNNGDTLDLITHTSGTTTGIGKPITISDHNRNSLVNEYDLAGYQYEPGMKMIHFIPYFAGYGVVNSAHLGLSKGLNLQQIPLFNPNDFSKLLIEYKINVAIATTPCWLGLINNPKFENVDLSFLHIAGTGGSPTSMEDEIKINNFLEKHGAKCRIMVGYGMSEFGGCVISDTEKYNEVGKTGVALPGVEIKIRDTVTNEIYDYRKKNVQGEVLIHSETMTSGILDGKEIVPMIEINGKKFVSTHDIMKTDNYGQFEYVGRTDGMFQRYDGYNYYPLHIEEFFKSIPRINDCCIVWEKSTEKNGNIPKIYIELDGEIESKEAYIDEIIKNNFVLSKKMNDSKIVVSFRDLPHKWVFLDSIPKNTMGKTDLHKLINMSSDEDSYFIDVEEDNSGIKKYRIEKEVKNKIR